ncbi:M28 family peptidase [Solwaraspora sp. WMMD406]|uniref:M28 family peptidase n=1 Tax=Solwaraspora sp. WMMD406 TaxID=3016095 RepID=UPI002416AE4B|nr:M28 family peptidase [Solwaraspora sp. WMMD406]MDG4763579.1 M28 family peptidase [Solwaraspora sp. WMMD406]
MGAPLAAAADRTFARPDRRLLAGIAALATLGAVGAATLVDLRPPAPRGADAPAEVFSAHRAHQHVEQIAAAPHPAGSARNDEVREYLVATLTGLGLIPEIQTAVGREAGQLSGAANGVTLAQVRNVIAQIPGTDPTGRVFLVAHYDSVQVGPGANDDGAGVATLLEVARALTVTDRPRNDVVLVFTDAEEACLCGASAFVSAHALASDGDGVVLNLEARGRTGPVITFETSRDNAALIDVFGRSAPHPVGTSFAVEVYRQLPNDTDFTPFLDAGFAGLNSAYLDGSAIYHTPQDTPESMNLASLQHHGDNTLGLTLGFGATDIPGLTTDTDATYFPTPLGLVHYSATLTWPLALLAAAAVAALAWLTRRRGRGDWPRLVGGFALAAIPLVLAPVAAQLLWLAVTGIRPAYADLLDPHQPTPYRLAVLALAATVVLTWYALLRRRIGPAGLAVGGLGWLAVLGVLLAAVAPGGSYFAALPALAGAIGGLVALSLRTTSAAAVVALVAAAVVPVVVLLPIVVLLFPALGMGTSGVAAAVAVLLGLAVLPVLDLLLPQAGGQRATAAVRARRLGPLPAALTATATVVLVVVGLAVDRVDADRPVPTHLMYALDADTGQARWFSAETRPQPWTMRHVTGEAVTAPEFPLLGTHELRSGEAKPATALSAPTLDLLDDSGVSADGTRTLRLKLVPRRPVRLVALHVAADTAEVRSATVAGQSIPVESAGADAGADSGEGAAEGGGRWSFGTVFHAPQPDGFEIVLVVRPTGDGPVGLRVSDGSDGLTGLPGFTPRPAGVGIAGSHTSELVTVARTYTY